LWREPFIAAVPADVKSVAAFALRRLGAEILDYAVDSFVAGVCAGDPDRISLAAAFRIHALEQKYGSIIRGQVSAARNAGRTRGRAAPRRQLLLPQRHANWTDASAVGRVTHGANVEWMGRSDDGRWIPTGTRHGILWSGGRRASLESAHAAAPLPACWLRRRSSAIPYAPLAIVATAYSRADVAHSLEGFGFLVPEGTT
jgi:oxygen-dependent protoporphyrinogen oxidase